GAADLQVSKAGDRKRYLELAVRPSEAGLPTVVTVKVDAAIADVPEIEIRGFDQRAFHKIESDIGYAVHLRRRADNGVVLIGNLSGFDLQTHVRKVVRREKPRFRCFPLRVSQYSAGMESHRIAHNP